MGKEVENPRAQITKLRFIFTLLFQFLSPNGWDSSKRETESSRTFAPPPPPPTHKNHSNSEHTLHKRDDSFTSLSTHKVDCNPGGGGRGGLRASKGTESKGTSQKEAKTKPTLSFLHKSSSRKHFGKGKSASFYSKDS